MKLKIKEKIDTKVKELDEKIENADPKEVLWWSVQAGLTVSYIAWLAGVIRTAKRATALDYLALEDGIMTFDPDRFNGWAMRVPPKRIKRFWKDLRRSNRTK